MIFDREKKISYIPRPILFSHASCLESLQTMQRFTSGEGQAKLHKTMSQGEIGKLVAAQKSLITDGR